jgi:CRISPR-associated endonuclease/helicase Cas3
LIEAGINISFHSVIRSIAGLDSIAQAAGRCNRHAERACSNVYIVNVQQENVDKLIDIKKGQECMRRILNEFAEDPSSFNNELLSPKAMERYYKYYFYDRRVEMNYVLPRPNNDKTIYDLLSSNNAAENAFAERNGLHPSLPLRQAFKTAGDSFEAIDQNTRGVLVPFEEGRELITLINGRHSLSEMKAYLNKVQQYSVNLYDTDIKKLEREGGIFGLMGNAVLALREGFYRNDLGVTFDKAPLDFISY